MALARSIAAALLVAGCAPAPQDPVATAPAPTPSPPPVVAAAKPAPKAPAISTEKVAAPKPVAAATKPSPAAAVPSPAAAAPPPLDLRSLEQRLKDTGAIGVLTKLSLKNQVDDLVTRFRAYHDGTRPPTLAELRPAFELLLMKVLSLLQDHDTALAKDITASREAIWGVLSDRAKLAKFV